MPSKVDDLGIKFCDIPSEIHDLIVVAFLDAKDGVLEFDDDLVLFCYFGLEDVLVVGGGGLGKFLYFSL